jgi:hypothetical protein
MKKLWLLAILSCLWPGTGTPQSTAELVSDGKNTEHVLTQSLGYDRKSYSPLREINTTNIRRWCRSGAPA